MNFVKYFNETWDGGMLAALWNKCRVEELQTTKLAVAYYSQLNTLIQANYPTMSRLYHILRDLNGKAALAVVTLLQGPSDTRFADHYEGHGITTVQADDYCQQMFRFVSNKTT
ncbi:hypothetical protein Aduo_015702 [Ancylostoma duodenale]